MSSLVAVHVASSEPKLPITREVSRDRSHSALSRVHGDTGVRKPRFPPRLNALFSLLKRADFVANISPIPITEGGWGRPLRQDMPVDLLYAGESELHPITLKFLTLKGRSERTGVEIVGPAHAKVRFLTQTAYAAHVAQARVGVEFVCLVGSMPVARGEIIKVTGLSRNGEKVLKTIKRSQT